MPLTALDTKKKLNYLNMIAPPSVQKRGAWAMYSYIHVIIHGRHVHVDKQKM